MLVSVNFSINVHRGFFLFFFTPFKWIDATVIDIYVDSLLTSKSNISQILMDGRAQ